MAFNRFQRTPLLQGLIDALQDIKTSEDVQDFGVENLREIARQDPEAFKEWKARNPKAYLPGQPLIVNGEVFSMPSGMSSPSETQAYYGALTESAKARNAATRARNREGELAAAGQLDRRFTPEFVPEDPTGSQSFALGGAGLMAEAQRVLEENAGRQANLHVGSLAGLKTSAYDTGIGEYVDPDYRQTRDDLIKAAEASTGRIKEAEYRRRGAAAMKGLTAANRYKPFNRY